MYTHVYMYVYIYIYIYIHGSSRISTAAVPLDQGSETFTLRHRYALHHYEENTHIIVRNHYSQLASHEGPLSRCEINPSWAIMGYF